MLSKEMYEQLNIQLNKEFLSANIYFNMGSWCLKHALKGCGKFLIQHGYEELTHMQKMFDYINETGGQSIIRALEEPISDFDSIKDVFDKVLAHERYVSKCINELTSIAQSTKDYATFSFLQWFITEQVEEESLFGDIVDRLNMLGEPTGQTLYMFDKEIESLISVVPSTTKE